MRITRKGNAVDRKKEQAELLIKLGEFLGPLRDLVNRPDQFDAHARARVFARAFVERDGLSGAVNQFVRGERGHFYVIQSNTFHDALNNLLGHVHRQEDDASLSKALKGLTPLMQSAILEVPVEGVSGILQANSPFTAYCRMKDISATALQVLIWTDRYFDFTIFHRYLREVRDSANITLVTLDPAKITQPKDRLRHNEFMDVSRLFAAERGPANYRLVAHPNFHDRWLRCDGQIYALGGSVKDAGMKSDFAISHIEPTAENMKNVDDLVGAGTELFGPSNTTHP